MTAPYNTKQLMKQWPLTLLLLVLAMLFVAPTPSLGAPRPLAHLTLTGSRVTDSFVPAGTSDLLAPGGQATYSLIIEQDQADARAVDASLTLPTGQHLVPGSLRVNGLPSAATTITEGQKLTWPGLTLPGTHIDAPANLAGLHVFLHKEPSLDEINQRLMWAAQVVGPGGTVKLFHPSITERSSAPYYWMVYAVQRCYQLGLRPVVRLGFANGDTSSFTRRHDDPVGQMNRTDAAGGYWGIGWGTRNVVAGLLADTAADAATAPSNELTVIVGNEPNLEWVDRDWFVDYDYVRQPDGSFDTSWLTTNPADPNAAANNPNGWKLFVRGYPGPDRPTPTADSRLDDYTHYLGYDAAVEYGRFLRTTSGLLRDLHDPRLQIAAGAIASGGGDLEGRYAYHQRLFMRRMLQAVPDALSQVDLWTTNNYPYTIPPWDNYHAHPAAFERDPIGASYWQTEIGIDSYRGDLDYLAYLKRHGPATSVPTRAVIGEVGYGIGEGWGTAFGGPHLTEDLRAQYMSELFEQYYNGWGDELAGANMWQLGDPDQDQPTYHMFDFVYPDSQAVNNWPTHRHLVFDAVATRRSRPGPGRLILTFQVQLDPNMKTGPATATATLLQDKITASYTLTVAAPPAAQPSK